MPGNGKLRGYEDESGIPTEDFTRGGRLYYLLDMTKKDEVGVDTKPYIHTITQASDTNNMEAVLQQLDAELEGYTATGIVSDEYARLSRERIIRELEQAA